MSAFLMVELTMRSVETARSLMGLHRLFQGIVDVVANHALPSQRLAPVEPNRMTLAPTRQMAGADKGPNDPAAFPSTPHSQAASEGGDVDAPRRPHRPAPAADASTRVRSQANRASDTSPGSSHHTGLPSLSHAQNAKQPAISAKARDHIGGD